MNSIEWSFALFVFYIRILCYSIPKTIHRREKEVNVKGVSSTQEIGQESVIRSIKEQRNYKI